MFVGAFEKAAFKVPRPKGFGAPTPKITPSIAPGNPVHGLKGFTGATAQAPFANPIGGGFGHNMKKGLVSRTSAIRGMKI